MGDISRLHKVRRASLPVESTMLTILSSSVTPFKANFMHSTDVTLGELKL